MMMSQIDRAIEKAGPVDSLAFDTWGVDYGLLDEDGRLLELPCHYRDTRTDGILERAASIMSADELYQHTGNQIMSINTLFQLLTDENVQRARHLLFMPDLFGYLLTGNMACEYTIASTSQMLDPRQRQWSKAVTDAFSIPRHLFPPFRKAPSVLGSYKGIRVITVAGHDTQCAVAAMPCRETQAAFLSCGTWSLIGCERDAPVLSGESNACALSNELGANGAINYLKNISGLWLIQKLRRDLAANGEACSYNELEQMARQSRPFLSLIDPDAPMLSSPGDLMENMKRYCRTTGQRCPESVGETARLIYEGLALKYRCALDQITRCTAQPFTVLHMLGGGTRDRFLCQLTADCLGIRVVAGPAEATALGNIILQLIALGALESVEQGRQVIAESEAVTDYEPYPVAGMDEAYKGFLKLIGNS